MDSSNFWKLDKIDKIGIVLIFIVFALYSTFSCFASESEIVEPTIVENLGINPNVGHFVTSTSKVCYVAIEPGYKYTLTSSATFSLNYCFSNELPGDNVPFFDDGYVSSTESFEFTYGDYKYVYFDWRDSASMTLTREPLQGMSGAVDNLSYYAGFNLWESFSNTIVYALPITITCFGIYIICGFVKRFSKGV